MTTIVYDHKNGQIACDSRMTRSGVVLSDSAPKWRYDKSVILFFTGCTCDFEQFMQHYGKHGAKPDAEVEADAFIVKEGIVYEAGFSKTHGYFETPLRDYSSSIGSGQSFALAALDFGKTAKEAVEYAATRDIYTGGQVSVFDIKTMTFLSVLKS